MNSCVEVVVLVEGPTEQRFVKDLLVPFLANKSVFLTPIIIDKPGEKGGDVKFARAKNDIEKHLKQRHDTWITLTTIVKQLHQKDWRHSQPASKRHLPALR